MLEQKRRQVLYKCFNCDIYDLARLIRVCSDINKMYLDKFNIYDLNSLIKFFSDKRKILDLKEQQIRTLKNIKETGLYECKSAAAAVLALYPNASVFFIQNKNSSYFNHVAILYNNTVIDLTAPTPVLPFAQYIQKYNVISYMLL